VKRIARPGGSLAVEDHGSGEPVALLHAGLLAWGMRPLMGRPALAGGRGLVGFHRRG
jgi:hypothetical protein